MAVLGAFVFLICATLLSASPLKGDNSSEEDPIGYLAEEANSILDELLREDNVTVGDGVEITKNDEEIEESEEMRSNKGFIEKIEDYLKTHDASFKLPFGVVKMEARNLDRDEVKLRLKLETGNEIEGARKFKLKRLLSPILVFILLKAITVVPMILGALLLKSFDSLVLGAVSFVISAGLAIFQLCKKIAENNAHSKLSAHDRWEGPQGIAARNSEGQAQELAYSAYVK